MVEEVIRAAAVAILLVAALLPRVAAADEPAQAAATPSPPAFPMVSIDSTRSFTVVERRANHVEGWGLTLPFPTYTSLEQWEPVCVAPCAVRLDPNGVYRVGGAGASPSGSFPLPHGIDPLHLHVHAGSGFWRATGIVTTVIGVASVVAGVVLTGGASLQADPEQTLKAGFAFIVPGFPAGIMPPNFSQVLTDEEIKDVVAYLMTKQ